MKPKDKQRLDLPGAQLAFYYYRQGDCGVIEFDSRGCRCPVPMVHAMLGLERIAKSREQLVMFNGVEPEGLYPRIEKGFDWQVEQLDGYVRICFDAKPEALHLVDFSNNHCKGS